MATSTGPTLPPTRTLVTTGSGASPIMPYGGLDEDVHSQLMGIMDEHPEWDDYSPQQKGKILQWLHGEYANGPKVPEPDFLRSADSHRLAHQCVAVRVFRLLVQSRAIRRGGGARRYGISASSPV